MSVTRHILIYKKLQYNTHRKIQLRFWLGLKIGVVQLFQLQRVLGNMHKFHYKYHPRTRKGLQIQINNAVSTLPKTTQQIVHFLTQKARTLGCLCVEADANSQTQDCKRNQKLEEFDNELRCLVLVVMRLLWRCVFRLLGDGRSINPSDVVFLHHVSGAVTMTHVLKIISCILPWFKKRQKTSHFVKLMNIIHSLGNYKSQRI